MPSEAILNIINARFIGNKRHSSQKPTIDLFGGKWRFADKKSPGEPGQWAQSLTPPIA
jgi:hypothetical protein